MSAVGFWAQKAFSRSQMLLTWPVCEGSSGCFMLRNSSDRGVRFDQRHCRVDCVSKDKLNSLNLCKDAKRSKDGNEISAPTSDLGCNGLHRLREFDLSGSQQKTRIGSFIVSGTRKKSTRLPNNTWTKEDGQSKRDVCRMHAKVSNTVSGSVLKTVRPSLFQSPPHYSVVNSYRSFSTVPVSGSVLPWTMVSQFTDSNLSWATSAGCVITRRTMAGHSKWQNIRHTKTAKDLQKAAIFSKIAVKIKLAVREGGSEDPKLNLLLARVVTQAKAKDMPSATIASAIKAGGGKDAGSPLTVEIKGPGQCLWIVETITDKPVRTKGEIRGMLKKYGCVVSEGNTVIRAFEKKGVVDVELEDGQEIDMDKYLEVAIESGAEDVEKREDDLGNPYLAFVCDVADLHSVKKAVEGRELPVKSAFHEYVARVPTVLSESEVANLQAILEKLQGHADVIRVFDNIQVRDV